MRSAKRDASYGFALRFRAGACYCADKTGLIRGLMESGAKVTLFTRPRRFGKPPNMSMLANFFSVEGDKSIFDGPEISKDAELCEKYMGKYPVIFLSMKETDSVNYDEALKKIAAPINETARKFAFWEHSEKTDEYDKEAYRELRNYEEIKDWYDGYKFGNINVYCPRDVINQCRFLQANPKEKPLNRWVNSSANYAVRKFVEMADGVTKKELEALVAGETIVKEIREDLTYSEIYKNINNLRSLLYTTGYLTKRGEADKDVAKENSRIMRLGIPNKEVRDSDRSKVRSRRTA